MVSLHIYVYIFDCSFSLLAVRIVKYLTTWDNRGRLVKDRASGQPKLNCRNWECGVLIPVGNKSTEDTSNCLSAFEKTVPVPMVVPGEAYGKSKSKEPWLFLEG